MNRGKVILAAFLIFATGVATGALSFRAIVRPKTPTSESRMPFGMLDARYDLLGKMKKELSISEDQSRRLDLVLQDGRKRMRAVWETSQPAMKEETKSVHDRIRAELTEGQRIQWEEMLRKSRERRGPRPEGENKGPWRRGERGSNQPPAEPMSGGARPSGPHRAATSTSTNANMNANAGAGADEGAIPTVAKPARQ